jgi:putative nucleotidyltransferase with HDIG domain
MFEGAGSVHFDRKELWKHSIGVAVITKMIAKKIKFKQVEEAFIAGLIHDIGKVVMDEYIHSEFMEVVKICKDSENSFYQSERDILGVTHSQIGKILATKWKLPKTLSDAVEFHHNPPSDPRTLNLSTYIVAMVHIADIVCKGQKIGFSGDHNVPNVDMSLWNVLGLKKNDVIDILKSISSEMDKAQEFFEMLEG